MSFTNILLCLKVVFYVNENKKEKLYTLFKIAVKLSPPTSTLIINLNTSNWN